MIANKRSKRSAGLLALSAAAAVAAFHPAAASAATAAKPMIFGVSAYSQAQVQDNEAALGHHVEGVRTYKFWDSKLFAQNEWAMRDTGHKLFLSIGSQRLNGANVRYADIAAATPGSPLSADLVRQAAEIKAFKAPIFLTFQHEPETTWNNGKGSGAEFKAAWRKVVSVYRAQGVTNAKYVFTMTAYSFKRTDAPGVANYYPGDDVVDAIGADAYNFNGCLGVGDPDIWQSLRSVIEAHRVFGRAHPGKGLMLLEFGSIEDPDVPGRKAEWIAESQKLFAEPAYYQYKAVLSWTGRNQDRDHCEFDYNSSPSAQDALGKFAADPIYQAGV